MTLSPDMLLRGAWYALEQGGLLLRDAVALYELGRHSTAMSIALVAQEELGKFQILLELRASTLKGQSLTGKEVRKECKDHHKKQRDGQGGVMLKGEAGAELETAEERSGAWQPTSRRMARN
jgi:AbiV family abortive infection protein